MWSESSLLCFFWLRKRRREFLSSFSLELLICRRRNNYLIPFCWIWVTLMTITIVNDEINFVEKETTDIAEGQRVEGDHHNKTTWEEEEGTIGEMTGKNYLCILRMLYVRNNLLLVNKVLTLSNFVWFSRDWGRGRGPPRPMDYRLGHRVQPHEFSPPSKRPRGDWDRYSQDSAYSSGYSNYDAHPPQHYQPSSHSHR